MKFIRSVYVALLQNMFFSYNHFNFFRKGHFYQAMPADLRCERSFPPPLKQDEDNTEMNPVLPIWETAFFPFWKPVRHFLVKFLFAKWGYCSSRMFPIDEKNHSTVSQMGTELQTCCPKVKTFQGVFPVFDYRENHRKSICGPIAEHVFLVQTSYFLQKGAFLSGHTC